MNLIAERLKEFRMGLGHNQGGLAKVAGMTQRAWSDWEESPPKALQSLVDLALHYGVSVDYLLRLTDDPTPRRDKLSGPTQELIQAARQLSQRRLSDLILIAKAYAEADAEDAKTQSGIDALAHSKRNQAGFEAAMNVYQRKHGVEATDDLVYLLLEHFPELAALFEPISPPQKRGVNKR